MAAKIYRFFAYYSAKERMDRSRELRFVLMDQVNDPNSVIDIDMEISGQNRSGSKITKPFSYRGQLSGLIKAANEFAIDISEFVNDDASGNIGLRYINQETGKKERYRLQLRETPLGVSAKFDSGLTQIRDTNTLVNDRHPTSETIFSFKFGDQAKRLDPFKPIQMYISQSTETNNNNFHLTIYAEEDVKVFGIVLPDNFPAVFDITSSNRIQSSANGVEDYYNLSNVNLRFKPGKTFEDFYASEYRVEISFLKRDGDNVELSPWTGSLLPRNKGFFQVGWHNLAFFNVGTPPEIATLKIVSAEEGKGRFLSDGVDITPTIGKYTTLYIDIKGERNGYIPSRDAIQYLRENPTSPVRIVAPGAMRNPLERFGLFLSRIENVSDNKIRSIRKIDYIIDVPNGLSNPAPTPQGSLFDEVNQIYFMGPFISNPMIVVNCNDGIVVDRVEIVRSLIASGPDFIVTGNPVKNEGLKGYTQSLTLKPIKAIEDIVDNRCTIRVTVSKSGRRESREFDLVDGARGRFAGQAMFFVFFNHGIIPSKITYGDFQHEHPYGRKPILFKAYENNSTTLLPETSAVSFFIRDGKPTPFYPIRRNPSQDYWGMPTSLEKNGRNSKIPNIAVIDTNKVIRKLSDFSERSAKFVANYSTFLVFDKKHNRLEFKLYSTEKTIAKNIEYFIATNDARRNLAQPETRLSTMAIFFVDDESGLPIIIADFGERDRENQFTRDKINSYSYTDDLRDTARLIDQSNYHTYNNTFSINVHNNGITRVFNRLISAGRKGKVVIAFHTGDASNTQSIYDYKYAYSCRLRDDIVQHTSDSRFLVFTGVDDIYTIPKMVDLQVTGHNSFTNKLLSGGIIYDAETMSSKYNFDHPRYDGLFIQPYTGSSMLYGMHREDDLTFNTSSQPSHTHSFARGNGFSYDNTTELLVVSMEGIADWEYSVEAIGVIGAGAFPSSPITPMPPPPNLTVSFPGVRYIQMNSYHPDVFENDNNGHLYTEVGFGNEWYERPEYTDEELQFLHDSVVISFEYNGRKYNARGIARDPQSVGTFIFKNDELWPLLGNDSSGTGRRFIVSWGDNQQEVKLYKDEHVFGLYSITPTYRYTDQVFKGRIGDTALPLGGEYFETEKFGVNRDYTSYRDSVIGTRTDLIIGNVKGNALNYIKTISYYKNGIPVNPPYGLVGFKYGQESRFSHPTMKQDVYIDGGINLDSYLPAVGEDFTTGLDNVNRDLSEWRYSGMQINMHNRVSYSNESGDIAPAFAQGQHGPIVVFKGGVFRTPRDSDDLSAGFLYVIEDDLVSNENSRLHVNINHDNSRQKTIIVFRGRFILNLRSVDFYKQISSTAQEVFIINDTPLANHYLISTRHQYALELSKHNVDTFPDNSNTGTNPSYIVNLNNIAHFQIAKAQLTGVANLIYLSMELPDKLDKPKADERFYFATEDTFLRRENTFQIETSNQSDNPKATRFFGNINTTNRDGNNVFRGTETEDIMQSDFVSIGHNEGDRKLMLLPIDAKKVKMFHKYNKMDNNQYTIDNRLKVIRGNDNHVTHVRAENVLYIQYSNNGSEVTSGIFFKSIFQMNSDLPFEFDVTTPGMGKVRHTFAKNFQRKGYWYTFYKSDKKYHKHSLNLGRSFEIVVHQNNRSRTDTIVYMNDANGINRAEHGYGLSTVLLDEFKEITDIFEGPGYAVNSSKGVQWVHMTNVNVTAYTSENWGGG